MSRLIEEQVVKMEFDNKGFESGVKESMSTLDKLKAALHFKDVNLSPLEQAFQKVENTASSAGLHIRDIWLKVSNEIENVISQKIVRAGEQLVKSLSIDNISDGWNKYEQKTSNVQTLMNSTGKSIDEVNGYLEQLMWYSDETSFGFTDMTSALSTMVSSGGDIEKLIPMIEGMGNATAYAGKGAAEFSRVIYNLNQSYSQGALSTMDWRSVEMAGAASKQLKQYLMEAAEEVGTIKKGTADVANWSEYLSKKVITSEAMEIAFKRFAEYTELVKEAVNSGQYETATEAMEHMSTEGLDQIAVSAFEAAQNYKSFSEAVDATKDAVSSGWLTTFEIIFGNFEEAKEIWTTIGDGFWEIFASGAEHRNDIFGELMNDPLDTFQSKIENCGISMEQFEWAFTEVARSNGVNIDAMIKRYGSFEDLLVSGNALTEGLIKKALTKLTVNQNMNMEATESAVSSLEKYQAAINKVFNDPSIGSGADRIRKLSEAGYDAAGTQKLINYLYKKNGSAYTNMKITTEDLINVLGKMDSAELKNIGINEEQLASLQELADTATVTGESFGDLIDRLNRPSGRELFFETLSNAMEIIIDALGIIKTSFREVFPETAVQTWYEVIERITVASRNLKAFLENEENAEKLTNSLNGLFSILKLITMITKGALTIGFKILNKVLSSCGMSILDLTSSIGENITAFVNWLDGLNIVETISTKIANVVITIKEKLSSFWEEFTNLPIVQEMVTDFTNALNKVKSVIDSVKKRLSGLFKTTKDAVSLKNLNNVLTTIYHGLKNFKVILADVADRFVRFFREIKNGKSILQSFKDNFGDVINFFKNLKTSISDFFDTVFGNGETSRFKELGDAIHDFFTTLDSDKVTAIVLTTVFGLFAINLLRLTNSIDDTVKAIGGTFTTLKNVINSYMKRQKNALLQIAEAVVIVAGALYVLSTIKEEDMRRALTALVTISACISVLMIILAVVTKITNAGLPETSKLSKFSEMAFALVALSGTMILAVFALKKIAELEISEGIIKKTGLVVGVIAVLATMAVVMGKFNSTGSGILGKSVAIVALAGALYIIALSVEKLKSIAGSPEEMESITKTMLKMIAGLAVLALAAGSIGGFSAIGILAVVILFEKLVPRIEDIVNYDYSKINKGLDKNKEVLEKIGVMFGIMVVIGGIYGKGFNKLGTGLLKVIGVLGLLVVIAKYAGNLNITEISKGTKFIKTLVGMLGVLMVCMGLYNNMSKLDKGQKGGMGLGTFIGIAITLGTMTLIAKAVSDMDAADLKKGIGFVAGLVGLVSAMFVVAGIASKGNGASFKNLALILAGVSFILGLMITMSIIKDKSGLIAAMAGIAVVLLSLSVLFAAVGKITQESKKVNGNSMKNGVATGPLFIAIVGVASVMAALMILSKQPYKNIIAASGAITFALLGFTAVLKTMQKIYGVAAQSNKKRLATVLFAGAALMAVSGMLFLLSKFGGDAKNMVAAGAAITIGLLGFTAVLKTLSKVAGTTKSNMKYTQAAVNITGAIGALIVVALAIGALSNFGGDPVSMISAAGAITIGMVGVAICAMAMGKAAEYCKEANFATSLEVILGAIGASIAVSAELYKLASLNADPQNIIASAIAIGIGTVAVGAAAILMGVAAKICSGTKWDSAITPILGAIAAMWVVSEELIKIAQEISPEQAEVVTQIAPSLAIILGVVAGSADLLAAAGLIGKNINLGSMQAPILAVFEVLGIIIAAAIALGALFEGSQGYLETYLVEGLDALVLVCEKIGEAVGKLIGNFVGEALLVIGEDLNTLMDDTHLGGFLKKISNAPEGSEAGALILAGVMASWIGVGWLSISSIFSGASLLLLGSNLKELMDYKHLGGFLRKIEDIPEGVIDGAKNLAAAMTAWIGVAWLDLITFFTGADFTKLDLAGLGEALVDFTDSVSDLKDSDLEKATKAAEIAQILADFQAKLPTEGGWLHAIIGDKETLAEFGAGMTSFALGISSLATGAKDITDDDKTNIQRVIDCADIISAFSATLEERGGLKGAIFGDKTTLDEFGSSIDGFVTNLTTFVTDAKALEELDPEYPDRITKVSEAVQPLVDLTDELEPFGGRLQSLVGYSDLASFSTTFIPFATNLHDLVLYLKQNLYFDYKTPITTLSDAVTPLVELSNKLNDNKSALIDIDLGFGDDDDLKSFGKQIKKFGASIKDFCEDNKDTDYTPITDDLAPVVTALTDVAGLAKEIEGTDFKNIKDAFDNLAKVNLEKVSEAFTSDISIISSITTMLTNVRTYITNRQEGDVEFFTNYGKSLINGIKEGIKERKDYCNTALGDVATSIRTTCAKLFSKDNFASFGKNIVEGLAEGLDDKDAKEKVISKANEIGKSAVETIAEASEVQSPSRYTKRVGRFIDEGLAIGISENTGMVIKASESMSKEAITATSSVISALSKSINSDIDFQPTIRPVLDTSDISEKSKEINKMLGSDIAYKASGSFNSSDLAFARNVAGTFSTNNSGLNSINSSSKSNNTVNNYNFTQNNNSPKALSRMEIYRQTDNQINMLRRAIG